MTDITAKLAEPPMTDDQIRRWIDACNHEPAREVLRGVLASRASQSTRDEETVERVADRFDHALNVALVAETLLKGFWFSDEKQAVRAARAALSAMQPRDEGLKGLRKLNHWATQGTWKEDVVDLDSSDIESDDAEQPVARGLNYKDASFIVAAVNYVRTKLAQEPRS